MIAEKISEGKIKLTNYHLADRIHHRTSTLKKRVIVKTYVMPPVRPGSQFADVAREAAQIAHKKRIVVMFEFNNKNYSVSPKETEGILEVFRYNRKLLESTILMEVIFSRKKSR